MTTTVLSADRYLAAFRSRREYCRALLDLSVEQQALVTAEDYPGLVELLNHKQQLLDALLDAGREPAALWQAWRTERDHMPGDVRQACEVVLDDAEQLLQQLLALEAESTQRFSANREIAQQLLRDVNQGSQLLAAYQSPSDPAAFRRLDLDL
ncbi:MAG TPA: flagellar export chaperone FlgN [Planctomycetaceae bacterium]|nr:flagellar export chaperone FlgN [Planctomycetaceae bacterium]